MKIGIGLPNQVPHLDATVIPAWAAQAEALGFSSLGTLGRIAYPGVMDTIALAAAAATTSTIGLYSSVLVGPAWPAVLLAKEAASIDAISGGRLTLGLGLGNRSDDYVVEGLEAKQMGRRLDDDIQTYRRTWAGAAIGGGTNPAVINGSRQVPLIFGGRVPATFQRVAQEGEGYVGSAVPAVMMSPIFDAVRAAWAAAGREGTPRLVATAYFALGNPDSGRANVHNYYSFASADVAGLIAGNVAVDRERIRAVCAGFEEIGADEIILNPATGDLDEVKRLAQCLN